VKIYPALFFDHVMFPSLKYLTAGCIVLILVGLVGIASISAAPQGFLEGRLKIVSGRPVQLDDENTAPETPTMAAGNYADYPLIVLTKRERKEITRIIADKGGNYRVALAPGDYILDVEGRVARRLRVKAQPFTVVANETVHVDMTIVTGFASE
jgi:hypothetical protein